MRQALPNTDEVAQMRNQLRALESELQEQQRRLVKSESHNQEISRQLARYPTMFYFAYVCGLMLAVV